MTGAMEYTTLHCPECGLVTEHERLAEQLVSGPYPPYPRAWRCCNWPHQAELREGVHPQVTAHAAKGVLEERLFDDTDCNEQRLRVDVPARATHAEIRLTPTGITIEFTLAEKRS